MSKIDFRPADTDFEESRRSHFFRGLNKQEYHKYFDTMYHLNHEKIQKKETMPQ